MISPLGIGDYIPRVTKSSRFLIDVLSAILIDTDLTGQIAVSARQNPKERDGGSRSIACNVPVVTLTIPAVYCIGVSLRRNATRSRKFSSFTKKVIFRHET